ncbi:DUF3466 family protein [Catenovulum sediminis]|uniref:DUF3466 family protein n=1 Tax=Catenovulum sediminis TaxID=1740262 RepID=UPI001FE8105A|nr:DUF3466 family protein [Catenovulum sediminis]
MMNKLTKLSTIMIAVLGINTALANTVNYRIEVVAAPEEFKNNFPVDINNKNEVASVLTYRFNHPIDVDLLDFDEQDFSLAATLANFGEDNVSYLESVRRGRFSATSLGIVLSYLTDGSIRSDGQHQQVASIRTAFSDENESTELAIIDKINNNTDEFYYHNNEHVRAINDLSWLTGDTQSFLQETRIDGENWLIPNYIHRGFVKTSNSVIELTPPYDEVLGGFSYATDVSNEGYIVGYGSVGDTFALQNLVASCENNNDETPEEICYWRFLNGSLANQTSYFRSHALMWKVNSNGEITETIDLGMAIDDSELPSQARYDSKAYSVNNLGLAVGETDVLNINNSVRTQAALFYQDNVQVLTNPNSTLFSRAVKINDNNIVVGTVSDSAGLSAVIKSFYYDVNSNAVDVTILDDFFVSAETKVRDINNSNQIVGVTEVEGLSSGAKPKHGFIYDLDTEEMLDLNSLLSCESDFRIVDAVAINDDGVILAHASLTQNARDRMGDFIGEDSNGDPITEQVEYTVKLIPDAEGQVACQAPAGETGIKRKGATMNAWLLFSFFITFLFKNIFSNRKLV